MWQLKQRGLVYISNGEQCAGSKYLMPLSHIQGFAQGLTTELLPTDYMKSVSCIVGGTCYQVLAKKYKV